jgi:transcriptional regulator with XRE-family HTH domain
MRTKELFYERLERLLKEKGFQQKDLAESCGISSNGISTWKVTGAIPRADIAIKMAKFLDVSTEYLITGELSGIDKKDDLAYTVAALSENKRHVVKAVIESLEVF